MPLNLLVILGPTASGKTRIGVQVARALGSEIISADSRQVYRGMDIGTGKDLAEYGEIPYHLIDIVDPPHEFNLFEFQRCFGEAFAAIRSRGRLPLLVGGTGMYLEAILRKYDLREVPRDAGLRQELVSLPLENLAERLRKTDPGLHNTTDLLQRERLIRAIEIARSKGRERGPGPLPEIDPMVFRIKWDRKILRQRITERLRRRLHQGLIPEVEQLHQGGLSWEMLDSYGLEYRFVSLYLKGKLNRNDLFQKLQGAIHQFAKRQETWFRGMERRGIPIHRVEGDQDPAEAILEKIKIQPRGWGREFPGTMIRSDTARPVSSYPLAVSRYLESRAVTGPWKIAGTEHSGFHGTVIIPALAEKDLLFETLHLLRRNPADPLCRFLILVVVNHRADSRAEEKENNRLTLERLAREAPLLEPVHLAWVNAAEPGLELPVRRGGVGMARRIGFDLALPRLDYQASPWLISLDADTLPRVDYLPALIRHSQETKRGGAVIPFCHQKGATAEENEAIQLYELFLRTYVLGLSRASSPYAFHTIGSAMACQAEAYARVGGMTPKTAAEDFYFLQNLARTAGVAQVRGTVVYPSARASHRVPFGTGRTISRFLAGDERAVLFYRVECFQTLKAWMDLALQNSSARGEEILARARGISPSLSTYLEGIRFLEVWEKIRRNQPRHSLQPAAFHGWFDGLKTLKLIHHLSDGPFPRGRPREVLADLFHWAGLPPLPGVEEQLALLREIQIGEPY